MPNYSIKKKTKYLDFKLVLFICYNLAYILYSIEKAGQALNFVILFILLLVNVFEFLQKNNFVIHKSRMVFLPEFMTMIRCLAAFAVMSLVIQLVHGELHFGYIGAYLYLFIPLIFALMLANNTDEDKMMLYFYVFLARFILTFFLKNAGNLTMAAISMIKFSDSESSIFESSDAHGLFALMILFLWKKNKKMAIISGIMCMLCFKRICFILTPIILILWRFVPEGKPGKGLVNTVMSFFILSPFVLNQILKYESFINTRFGLNLNKFTTGRMALVRYVMENMGKGNGYGSVSSFMETNPWHNQYVTVGQMHCDVMQLYYELTLIGVAIFFYSLYKISKESYASFILCVYFSLVMMTSHFLDVLFVWIIFYMFIAYQKLVERGEKKKELERILLKNPQLRILTRTAQA